MLTTSFLACTAPRLVAPAMNDRMYADAATQANLATLRERGVEVIEPERGPARLARRARPWPAARPGALLARSRRCCGGGRPIPATTRWRRPSASAGRDAPDRAAARPGRPAGPGHGGRHPRADRLGALHRQPLERADGHGPRRRRGEARRRGDGDRGERLPARARRGQPDRRRDHGPARLRDGRTVRDPARAADGRRSRRLPHRADHRQDQAPGQPQPESAADRGHPRRARRRSAARGRRSSASPPSTGATRSAGRAPS